MLSDWSDTIVIRAMLKPSIAFLPLPQEWNLSAYASNNTIDNSANNIANNIADNSANSSINNSAAKFAAVKGGDLAKLSPAAGDATAEIAADDVAVSAGQKTALSSESKDILNKMPPLADSKKLSSSKKKVDINRAREVGDVLTSADNAASSPEALGVKLGSARSQFDVNYELERAYNALIAGNSEVAIQIYEDILTGNPQNKEALFGLASTYHRSGQLDLARSLYGKLLQLDPKNRDGLNNFLVLLAEEAPQEALTQMEKLETQNPEFSPIPAQMAIIYQKLGNSDKAIDKMYRALAIAPENMTYRYNLAVMLDGSGKFDDASKLYAQILSSHAKGEVIPGDAAKIQQRLTFIRSNNARTSLLGAVR